MTGHFTFCQLPSEEMGFPAAGLGGGGGEENNPPCLAPGRCEDQGCWGNSDSHIITPFTPFTPLVANLLKALTRFHILARLLADNIFSLGCTKSRALWWPLVIHPPRLSLWMIGVCLPWSVGIWA